MQSTVLQRVIDVDADEDAYEPAWTPGLPALRAQQEQLLRVMRGGLEDRRDVLFWTHAVAVFSLGQVGDEWFAELLGDRFRVGSLLASQSARDALCTHPPSDRSAHFIRDDLQQTTLAPAFRRARTEIRRSSSDFVEGGQNNPSGQRFIAMRPRVHQFAIAQDRALRMAFEGFASRREVLDWANYLDYATTGYLPDEFPRTIASPMSDWWHVLTGPGRQGAWLESRLAATVLPAANKAIRNAMQVGTEEPRTEGNLQFKQG